MIYVAIVVCVSVFNVQMIAGPADNNGEHEERDGICENPDRRSGHGRDGGGSIGRSLSMCEEVLTNPNILGTNGI